MVIICLITAVPFLQTPGVEGGCVGEGISTFLFYCGPLVGGEKSLPDNALTDSTKDTSTKAM